MWDDYYVSLTAPLVTTRLLTDEIYHLTELPFKWLIWNVHFCLFTWWFISSFFFQFDIGNQWIWTRIDYHHFITSEPTNRNWKTLKQNRDFILIESFVSTIPNRTYLHSPLFQFINWTSNSREHERISLARFWVLEYIAGYWWWKNCTFSKIYF